jgi:acetolactate synthase-1/2/3 large subunit/sulfoacetaldehyde acetyltransferase
MMAKMSAGHAVAESLSQLGVRNVIGMVGSCMIEILDGIYERDDLHFLTVRHEQSAALMADAFGRMTGKPGVCMATNGPGVTNLVTGVANAKMAQSPVVVITGAPMMKDMDKESTQEIDQIAMFKPIVKDAFQARRPDQAADFIRQAYQLAMSGIPGPVQVDLPRDVMNEEVEAPNLDGARSFRPLQPAPDPASLEAAAELLKNAERPLILAGGGVIWADASSDLLALAEALDAPIMTSTGRDDVVPTNHPLALASIGRGTIPDAADLFKEADVVLAVGTRLAHSTNFLKPEFFAEGTKLIHAAHDARNVGRHYMPDVGMVGDSGIVVRGLKKLIGENKPKAAWRARADEVKKAQEAHRESGNRRDGTPIDPRRAHAALAKVLPEDAVITIDAGSAAGYVYEYHRFGGARSLLAPQDLAAIGIGYPVGLGAKLACPDRPVVTISGDGAFLCNGSELETAIREKLPTLCVILNNFNLGSERAYQRHFYSERYIGDQIGNPRFDDYARSFGAVGYRVENPNDLEDVYKEALGQAQDKPVLVDVIIDQDIFPEPRRKDAVKK